MHHILKKIIRKPSTRSFYDQFAARPDFSIWKWLHGYIYARWPYLYIAVGTGRHPICRFLKPMSRMFNSTKGTPEGTASKGKITFAETYHGKVLPLEQARQLVSVNRDIVLDNLEQIIPYTTARDIILQHPEHIVALQCPCRASSPAPCLPTDVCLIVGEPFASFIAEHHPHKSRWINRQEAMDILQSEHERGHVHHAFFKDVMLGRFYAICNCCACCCGAMQALRNGIPMLAPSGFVCQKNQDKCIHCGLCAQHCQFNALDCQDGQIVLDFARCMGCGVCVTKCPQDALRLVRDSSKGEPLDIRELTTKHGHR
jgi:ferredoxin